MEKFQSLFQIHICLILSCLSSSDSKSMCLKNLIFIYVTEALFLFCNFFPSILQIRSFLLTYFKFPDLFLPPSSLCY